MPIYDREIRTVASPISVLLRPTRSLQPRTAANRPRSRRRLGTGKEPSGCAHHFESGLPPIQGGPPPRKHAPLPEVRPLGPLKPISVPRTSLEGSLASTVGRAANLVRHVCDTQELVEPVDAAGASRNLNGGAFARGSTKAGGPSGWSRSVPMYPNRPRTLLLRPTSEVFAARTPEGQLPPSSQAGPNGGADGALVPETAAGKTPSSTGAVSSGAKPPTRQQRLALVRQRRTYRVATPRQRPPEQAPSHLTFHPRERDGCRMRATTPTGQ